MRATTGLDQNYQPVRTPLDPSGATQVLATASFVLKFDRFLLPSAVDAAVGPLSVCLSGDLAAQVRTYADCVNPIPVTTTYNPIQRELIVRQAKPAGDDLPILVPGTRYALTVLGPADEATPSGIRAFDGAPLRGNTRVEFTVATTSPAQARLERQPSGDFFCERDLECIPETPDCLDNPETPDIPNDPKDPTCAACVDGAARALFVCAGCHGDSNAAAGLNLNVGAPMFNRLEGLHATAIGRVAHQTQVGERAHVGEETPERFGRAMPLIDPGNPGNSYLLYKILLGESVYDPSLTAEEAEQLRAETERLRAAFVMGLPMPPPNFPPSIWFHPQTDPNRRVIRRVDGMDILTAWILDGAVTRDCSLPAPP